MRNRLTTLALIQQNVFTPICTACHTGSAAPLGLVLDAGAAWSNLVGVESVEVSSLLRVSPGSPDSSYSCGRSRGGAGSSASGCRAAGNR
ncbi:MAG: hypothetical protein PVH00_08915 [Gemmatimonadota bacterium]|jgi:hypothetical protein